MQPAKQDQAANQNRVKYNKSKFFLQILLTILFSLQIWLEPIKEYRRLEAMEEAT